jgi:predicted branched-subunit amino acid permease
MNPCESVAAVGSLPPPTSGPRSDVRAGARAMAPWLAGVGPFGFAIGVTAAQTGVDPLSSWLTAPLIYAGSAQLVTINLLDAGAGVAVVLATVLAVNLRMVVYSATMAPYWQGKPLGWRALAAYLLVDPSLAVGVDGYLATSDCRRGHARYFAAAVTLWVAWIAVITTGLLVGDHLPDAPWLALAPAIFLAGEAASRVVDRPTAMAVAATAATALVTHGLPLHLGPVLAIAVGLAVGVRTSGARA